MGNKRKENKTAKATVDNLSRSSPRLNIRGRLNENVTLITGNEFNTPAVVTATNTLGYGSVTLAPGNTAGRSNAAVQAVGRYFQKGVYLPGTFVRYIPSVGLNTAGNIIIGFVDNPDMMRAWQVLAPGAHLNFIRDLNNAKTAPVWQELTLNLTQVPRRRIFNIDPSVEFTNDAYDQTVQGQFLWCVYGVEATAGADKSFGQLMIHCKNRFEEVKSFITPQP